MAVLKYKNPDGQWETITYVISGGSGTTGKDGVGITKAEINDNGELIITLSDNTVSNLGVVVGAKGETGTDGLTPHINENGNWQIGEEDTGIKATGVDGTNGDSAYDVAKKNGFVGTEEEWLVSLKGAAEGAVSYLEDQSQIITETQKGIARNNIGAVDASLVVSEIFTSKQRPNGAALHNYFVSRKSYSEEQKIQARANIDAVSQTDFNTTIGNINSILATVVNGGAS